MAKIIMAWAIQGPAAGKVLKLSPEDFEAATKAGWAVPFKQGLRQKPDREAKNPAADAYFAKVPGYQNRELVSGEAPAPKAARNEAEAPKRGRPPKATTEDEPEAKTEPKTTPAKK